MGVGALGIVAATALTDVQSTTTILAIMLGLAVGIDYGLFILSRLRQELVAGRSVPDAVGVATGTAGSAVVTAGLTVVIALAGLSVVGIPFLTQMGVAAAATVAVAVLVALTLLPALAGVLGLRLLSRRQRQHLQRMRDTTGRLDVEPHAQHAHAARRAGVLPAWARFVTRQRLVSLLAVVVVLGVVAVPVFSLRTTLGDDSTAEEGQPAAPRLRPRRAALGPRRRRPVAGAGGRRSRPHPAGRPARRRGRGAAGRRHRPARRGRRRTGALTRRHGRARHRHPRVRPRPPRPPRTSSPTSGPCAPAAAAR
ncbi:MAG: MMPL family transporter [Quadrisphaera sp.]